MTLEDSTTYQWILRKGTAEGLSRGVAEGVAQGVQDTILQLGAKRSGPAPERAEAAVRAVTDAERLNRLVDKIFDATDWDDLLATP